MDQVFGRMPEWVWDWLNSKNAQINTRPQQNYLFKPYQE
jgi:hypothetical protein